MSNWSSPEFNKINDDIKNNLALNNNLHMIRISQEDVWFDRDNWEINLKTTIKNLSDIPILYKIGKMYFL